MIHVFYRQEQQSYDLSSSVKQILQMFSYISQAEKKYFPFRIFDSIRSCVLNMLRITFKSFCFLLNLFERVGNEFKDMTGHNIGSLTNSFPTFISIKPNFLHCLLRTGQKAISIL